MQISSPQSGFTVYQTSTAIELRADCENSNKVIRVISTSRSYENARAMAEVVAKVHSLALIDYVSPP